MIKLTVFTPTYNRAHLLPRLYKSLCEQTAMNFIWMIIDDGSTDGTFELVRRWQQEKIVQTEYHFKNNGGMHTAHNLAYQLISTDWNTCIDSDDMMPNKAVELINEAIELATDESYYGIVGLDAGFDGVVLGEKFPEKLSKVRMTQLVKLYSVTGDKKLVCKSKIMKELPPYPEYPGEKLVPLSYKSLEAEKKYYLKPVNEILCWVEYQPDGSTKNMLRNYRKNPKGFAFMRIARLNSGLNFSEKIKNCILLVSSVFFSGDFKTLLKTKETGWVIAAIPLGLLVNIYIRLKRQKP
ncbi:MAG TPA: glycosyltransferase [Chryseobacterium sp.]|nr:glycosyltransferase [Chryseobacterium sp.]